MPNVCVRVPVVIGLKTAAITLTDNITFTVPAFKIIDVLMELELISCTVVNGRVLFTARLTKNIIYKEAPNAVGEGIVRFHEFVREFSDCVEIPCAVTGDECVIECLKVRPESECLTPITRDGTGNILVVKETVVIDVAAKAVRQRQLTVNAVEPNICP